MKNTVAKNLFDKDFYIKALVALAKVDGKLSDEELEFIKLKCDLLKLDYNNYISSSFDINQFELSNSSVLTRKTILRDLTILAHADGIFDTNEKEFIMNVSNDFQVDNTDLIQIFEWVSEYRKIMLKGQELIEN